jgi:transglutaminase-like putative cysteine protease
MDISVEHRTDYVYEHPFAHAVQALRLSPPSGAGQKVLDWKIDAPGIEAAPVYFDGFGNRVHLLTPPGRVETVSIIARGTVRTEDMNGVAGFTGETAPPAVFLRETLATRPDAAISELAQRAVHADRLSTLHGLLENVHRRIAYEVGATNAHTSAAEALRERRGVCQDHAQVFIAAARSLGIPARYVTGYLLIDSDNPGAAHHAWAEAHTEDLGWIGFDPANGICPTDSYVRLAVGLDAVGAAPVRGIRQGRGGERLGVEVVVRQNQQ